MKTTEVNKVRELVIQVIQERPVPHDDTEGARRTIRRVCEEASLYGLTTAEVLRAIFKPALKARSHDCNCATCQALRNRRRVGEMLETRR